MDLVVRRWLGLAENALASGSHSRHVLGIDLGTTNTTATHASLIADSIAAVPIEFSQQTDEGTYSSARLPSFVAVQPNGTPLVGEGAKRRRAAAAHKKPQRGSPVFYECKNDMGRRKTYHQAPEGFRSAVEIATHVLRFVIAGARPFVGQELERIVITVPASFRGPQRQDTIHAARGAGVELTPTDLLDEPIAAFLDFAIRDKTILESAASPRSILVFDFGGGTCDAAVLRFQRSADGRLDVATKSVSRYYRLGGGDIDRAILHDVLVEKIAAENGLATASLSYRDKKEVLEPTFLADAESLKEKLCREISRLDALGTLKSKPKGDIVVALPTTRQTILRDKTIKLTKPSLSLEEFERILGPFLEHESLHPQGTEYVERCSIFAPIRDALQQAGLQPHELTDILIVGGSSLIPQVAHAIREFTNSAVIRVPDNYEDVKQCVSRGAAYYALSLVATGRPPVRVIAADDVHLRHATGSVVLLDKGLALPFPANGRFATCDKLSAPETSNADRVPIRIEVLSNDGGTPVYSELVKINGPIRKGDPLLLRYRVDVDQVLDLRVRRASDPEKLEQKAVIENPFTTINDPSSKRAAIDELEEKLRTTMGTSSDRSSMMLQLAEMLAAIGHRERAIEIAMVLDQRSVNAETNHRLGFLVENLGQREVAEACYRRGLSMNNLTSWMCHFHLVLLLSRHGRNEEAATEAIGLAKKSPAGVVHALCALTLEKLARHEEAKASAENAIKAFEPVVCLDRFELSWLRRAAAIAGDHSLVNEVEKAWKKAETPVGSTWTAANLPILRPEE